MENKEITHFHIADNSDALREWLKARNIEYIPNGHFTSIKIEEDIFSLGMKFGVYKYIATKSTDFTGYKPYAKPLTLDQIKELNDLKP